MQLAVSSSIDISFLPNPKFLHKTHIFLLNAYPEPKNGSWKGAQKPGWNYLKRVHCSGKKPLYTHFWRKGLFKHEGSHNRAIGEEFFASRDEGGPRHNNTDFSRNWVEIPGGYWISARFWVHRGRLFYKNAQETPETEGDVCRSRSATLIAPAVDNVAKWLMST